MPVSAVFPALLLCVLPTAAQSLASADSLLAQGDTNAAIAALETLVARNWRDAEARWRVGQLYMTRHRPGASLSPNRRRAEEHLRYATRIAPDSAKYWLALASLFRGEDWAMTRMQVERLLERALRAGEAAGDTASLAAASYRAGRVELERWEHFGRRWEIPPSSPPLTEVQLQSEWRGVEQFFTEVARPIPGSGEPAATGAERHFRNALALRPDHLDAAGALVVLLGLLERWPEAHEVAVAAARAVPDSGRAWALLGLVQTRLQRWSEAERSYARGLERMTPEQRAPYTGLDGILRAGDRARLAQMTPTEREATLALYWDLAQPLMLTEANEARTEYYARITFAQERWRDPERGLDGAHTDRGVVYVRFGPPDLEAVFGRSQVTWIYWPSRLRFSFHLTPGFANARFGEFSREAFEEVERTAPGRFDNVPVVRSLDTITTQLAQFRGAGGRTDVAVFGWVPVDRLVGTADLQSLEVQTAAIVRNDGGEVARVRRDEVVEPRRAGVAQHRAWRFTLPRAEFYLRLEALAPALNRAARHSGVFEVRSFAAPIFLLSDVLLARRLAPQDSAPARWTDFFIEPSAGRVEPGEAVSLLWEQYNLTPAADGIARWHVELRVTVTAVERRTFLAQIVGGIGDAMGASAVGSDRISLSWDREDRVAQGGTVVEWVTLDFGDAPAGSYTITVAVTDRISGRTVERSRTLVRSTLEPER